ncbi:hypothetical protein T4A_5314, partial [Trichinella pseudospiralis]
MGRNNTLHSLLNSSLTSHDRRFHLCAGMLTISTRATIVRHHQFQKRRAAADKARQNLSPWAVRLKGAGSTKCWIY